jgi:hypothetical protein
MKDRIAKQEADALVRAEKEKARQEQEAVDMAEKERASLLGEKERLRLQAESKAR